MADWIGKPNIQAKKLMQCKTYQKYNTGLKREKTEPTPLYMVFGISFFPDLM
ncbi:hypothetical protein [Peribacillus sp. TH14]|uniref:hypothetical protein n=1 Tax=Peribacillus sp. TH14 TaxID=2798481 RepID=UPI00191191C4|nr:hypothetical protein [Peribacillus sp. TH14]MBK5500010.1 hypothetical protein [Peribacillus sp. TH14]